MMSPTGAFGYVLKGLLKQVHANGHDYHMPIAMKTLKSKQKVSLLTYHSNSNQIQIFNRLCIVCRNAWSVGGELSNALIQSSPHPESARTLSQSQVRRPIPGNAVHGERRSQEVLAEKSRLDGRKCFCHYLPASTRLQTLISHVFQTQLLTCTHVGSKRHVLSHYVQTNLLTSTAWVKSMLVPVIGSNTLITSMCVFN